MALTHTSVKMPGEVLRAIVDWNAEHILSGSAGQIPFQVAGGRIGQDANLFWDNTNKRLGIGTASPRTKFEVDGDLPTSIPTYTNTISGMTVTDGGDIYARLGVADLSGSGAGYPTYLQAGDWGGAVYYNLLLNPLSGNVGIGTTTPGQKLEVYAGSDTANILWGQNIRNNGNADLTGYGSGLKLKISSDVPGEVNKWAGIAAVAGLGYANRVDMAFYSSANAAAPTELMRIQGSGNVGIGTASPATSALLDLSSTTGALLTTRMNSAEEAALTAVNGMIIYNSQTNKFRGYENGAWRNI